MPIRFRCVYCNQLLGIAHRKAGTVVRCPTCAGQVVVPSEEAAAATQQDAGGAEEPFLFEQNDFDKLFTPGAAGPVAQAPQRAASGSPVALAPQPRADAPAGAWGTHAEPPFDVERIEGLPAAPSGGPSAGIVLSPTKATILCVAWIASLLVAFGLGMLLGVTMRPPPEPQPPLPVEGRGPDVSALVRLA